MQGRMIFVAIFSCFVASTFTASISPSSSEEMFDIGMLGLGLDPSELQAKFKKVLEEECRNLTGSDEAYKSIERQPDILLSCVMETINVEQIMEEVQQAMMTDKYESLFKRSCNVSKAALPCVENFLEVTQICMDEEEKQLSKLGLIIIRALLDFTCSKSLEEFEKIIDSKSDECLNSKEEQMKACTNSIAMRYMNAEEDQMIENTFNLLTKEEGCMELVNLESCVVSAFDDCSNKVPVEVGRDLIRSVIEQTPCRGMKGSHKAIESNDL